MGVCLPERGRSGVATCPPRLGPLAAYPACPDHYPRLRRRQLALAQRCRLGDGRRRSRRNDRGYRRGHRHRVHHLAVAAPHRRRHADPGRLPNGPSRGRRAPHGHLDGLYHGLEDRGRRRLHGLSRGPRSAARARARTHLAHRPDGGRGGLADMDPAARPPALGAHPPLLRNPHRRHLCFRIRSYRGVHGGQTRTRRVPPERPVLVPYGPRLRWRWHPCRHDDHPVRDRCCC